jgi:hypothetical protein
MKIAGELLRDSLRAPGGTRIPHVPDTYTADPPFPRSPAARRSLRSPAIFIFRLTSLRAPGGTRIPHVPDPYTADPPFPRSPAARRSLRSPAIFIFRLTSLRAPGGTRIPHVPDPYTADPPFPRSPAARRPLRSPAIFILRLTPRRMVDCRALAEPAPGIDPGALPENYLRSTSLRASGGACDPHAPGSALRSLRSGGQPQGDALDVRRRSPSVGGPPGVPAVEVRTLPVLAVPLGLAAMGPIDRS